MVLLILAIAGWALFSYFVPPENPLDGRLFQGLLNSEDEQAQCNTPVELKAGAHVYYATSDLTWENWKQKIQPVEKNQYFMAYYSAGEDGQKAGFYTYPEEGNSEFSLNDEEIKNFKIKAYRGVIVLSKKASQFCDGQKLIKQENDYIDSVTQLNIGNLKDTWLIVPTTSDLKAFLDNQVFGKQIAAIWSFRSNGSKKFAYDYQVDLANPTKHANQLAISWIYLQGDGPAPDQPPAQNSTQIGLESVNGSTISQTIYPGELNNTYMRFKITNSEEITLKKIKVKISGSGKNSDFKKMALVDIKSNMQVAEADLKEQDGYAIFTFGKGATLPKNTEQATFEIKADIADSVGLGHSNYLTLQASDFEFDKAFSAKIGKESLVSPTKTVIAKPDGPSEVQNLKVVFTKDKSTMLGWDPKPNEHITDFEITYKKAGGLPQEYQVMPRQGQVGENELYSKPPAIGGVEIVNLTGTYSIGVSAIDKDGKKSKPSYITITNGDAIDITDIVNPKIEQNYTDEAKKAQEYMTQEIPKEVVEDLQNLIEEKEVQKIVKPGDGVTDPPKEQPIDQYLMEENYKDAIENANIQEEMDTNYTQDKIENLIIPNIIDSETMQDVQKVQEMQEIMDAASQI